VVKAAYGSTGKFYAQIKNGAPFEAFLSADDTTPTKLIDEGAAVAGTHSPMPSARWCSGRRSPTLSTARRRAEVGEFNKVAVANPKTAPYGAAAIEV
jgi:molybdate transport system substrate-binding protein